MDVHKPRPWHGWREFLKEYGIIVLGVVTALALEQAVEWLHWRHEVREARKALDVELSHDLYSFKFDLGQSACTANRLTELQNWVGMKREGRFVPLKAAIVEPDGINLHFAIWDGAAGETRAHIPLEARMAYAKLYDIFRAHKMIVEENLQSWDRLDDYSFDASTDRTELQTINGLVRRIQGNVKAMSEYGLYIDGLAHDLGLQPNVPLSPADKAHLAIVQRKLCIPLL